MSGDFVFLLQYFKPEKPPVEVSSSVKGSTGRTVGAFSLADCPHIFGCRQVMLNKDGVVMTVSLHKGVRYTVSFSTNDSGFAALVRGTYNFLLSLSNLKILDYSVFSL